MQPDTLLVLVLLQSGGNPWGTLTALAAGIYGAAVVLCLVIGGGILSTAGLDPDSATKGWNWIKRGFRGGALGLAAVFIYQFADGLF